jgi:hypothetical protein
MKKMLVVLALVALAASLAPLQGQTKRPGEVSKLMEAKLKNAKQVLEGLALGDFDKIARSGEELIQLSRAEEWHVVKTPRYELHSNEFRRAAETIVQKAKAKNLDGAALGYVEMTMSCVRCHQYVREVRDARLPAPGPDLALLSVEPRGEGR